MSKRKTVTSKRSDNLSADEKQKRTGEKWKRKLIKVKFEKTFQPI